jgi:hypothetical protein
MANVLLSFLGTRGYVECNYEWQDRRVEGVRFIQEALAVFHCLHWKEADRLVYFLTDEARKKNWSGGAGGQRGSGSRSGGEGLEARLRALVSEKGLAAEIQTVAIPAGRDEPEMWRIFDAVCTNVKEGEHLFFDITHALRSIPMLTMILVSYLKVVKNIKVGGVYYGAFETLGDPDAVVYMPPRERNVPVFDLTPFARLFDWTQAIHGFLTYGDGRDVRELVIEEIKPVLAKTHGADQAAKSIRKLTLAVDLLTQYIRTCRGPALVSEFRASDLRLLLDANEPGFVKALDPLLEKVGRKTGWFKDAAVDNGYAAVRWCIDHDLTQQGYTLLQETIVTDFQERTFDAPDVRDKGQREIVSQALTIEAKRLPQEQWKREARENPESVEKIRMAVCSHEGLAAAYNSLTEYRNDINHGGYSKEIREPDDFPRKLTTLFVKVCKALGKAELSAGL